MKAQTLRKLAVTTLAATCMLSSQVIFASPLAPLNPVHAFAGKVKTVSFSLQNNSDTTIQLVVGDNSMTLEAGKAISVKLPVGTRITTTSATKIHKPGDLIVEVAPSLNGSTLMIG